jgi:hypothetical protein
VQCAEQARELDELEAILQLYAGNDFVRDETRVRDTALEVGGSSSRVRVSWRNGSDALVALEPHTGAVDTTLDVGGSSSRNESTPGVVDNTHSPPATEPQVRGLSSRNQNNGVGDDFVRDEMRDGFITVYTDTDRHTHTHMSISFYFAIYIYMYKCK